MLRRITLSFCIFSVVLFIISPVSSSVHAQEPSPPSAEPGDPGRAQDTGKAVTTNAEDVIGKIGSGRVNEQCRSDITIDSEKIINNIDFDVPYVPGWLEGAFYGAIGKVAGNSGSSFTEMETQINDMNDGSSPCDNNATPSTTDPNEIAKGNCVCNPVANFAAEKDFCSKLTKAPEVAKCQTCVRENKGMWTAVGCIDYDFNGFMANVVFKLGIGLAGLAALLTIIYGAFILQTSRGDPEKIQHAREIMTSCILGLMLIIFSVFILEFIGISILSLDKFGLPIK